MLVLIRRLGFYAVTAFIAITLDFFIPHMIPGNPVEAVISSHAGAIPPQAAASLYAQFGINLHEGLWSQYLTYWNHLFHGNLGLSISQYPATVTTVIHSAIFWTILLVGAATVISFILGTVIGTLAAWKRGSWLEGFLPITTFFQAMPYFFLATLLVLLFSPRPALVPEPRRVRLPGEHDRVELGVHQGRDLPRRPARPHDRRCVAGRLDHRHAQHDGHGAGRGLRPAGRGRRPADRGGSSGTRPAMRFCRRCRASRWR